MVCFKSWTLAITVVLVTVVTCARAEECLLYSVRPDGTGLRIEVEAEVCPGYSAYGSPHLSPNGERLIFDASPTNSTFNQAKILVKDIAGDEKGQIEDFDFGNCPVWSPDGKRIALSLNSRNPKGLEYGAWIIDANGDNAVRISNGRLPRWTPDGKSLITVIVTARLLKLGKVEIESKEIVPFLEDYSFVEQIRWFPDGKRVLAHIEQDTKSRLVTMAADGAERSLIELAEGDIQFTAMSFDGKSVSYVSNNDRGGNDIFIVAADGKSKPRKLELLPNLMKEDFCWLKEDNRIVFNAPGKIPVDAE